MNNGEETRGRIENSIGIAALAMLALGCLLILSPFISAALWAAILCYTTWPLFAKLKGLTGERRTLSALIAMLLLSAIIVAPVAILVAKLSSSLSEIIAASQRLIHQGPPAPPEWVSSIPLVGERLASYWTLLTESSSARLAEMAKLLPAAQKIVLGGGRALGGGIFQIILSLLLVFIFYRDGEAGAERLRAVVDRIGGEQGVRLLGVAAETTRAVVYGVLGTALFQGVLAAIGFMIARVPGATLLGFITFIVATIPGGPAVVAAPAAFWLYRQGSSGWAIFIMVWGVIVGTMDNFVRPFLISRGGGTTPLILVIFGVIGGAMAFGLIGLFLGPTLLAVGYSLFEVWSAHPIEPSAEGADRERINLSP
ncbi:MAG: AI-2E family transporter [Candidatus Binatus sp.]|uniref:AI-2E family transporter n=1 Tax=Candidatus Binatus sp. TaxID=2811406 RepID=UPI00271A25EA|nr:AI-2E family transporter [Candidatus Binatus sp.]MDO8431636.1 AI-2E family transporter [Candidatus Binatus sp.]